LSDSTLGVILLAMAEGSVLSLPVAGGLVGRFGSRPMTALAGLALCLALPLPVVSGSGLTLALSLALLGAANGTLDVSMNAQALSLERRYQRPIMSSLHACFSLGGAAGAALAGILMWLGVGDTAHVSFAAAVGAGAVITVWGFLLPAEPRGERPAGGFGWPAPALLFMGALAFVGLLAEGAMADWSAVYLHDSLKASPALAAAGFAAFSLAMTAGRLPGTESSVVWSRSGASGLWRARGGGARRGTAGQRTDRRDRGIRIARRRNRERHPGTVQLGRERRGQRRRLGAGGGRDTWLPRIPGRTAADGLTAEHLGLRAALGLVCVACAFVMLGANRLPRV